MNSLLSTKRKKVDQFPILVVEDNADHWLIIRAALKECFPEVAPVWVTTPDHALVYLNACTQDASSIPRLILLDLYIPRRDDGWALLASIKKHLVYQRIPVCVLSHSADQTDIETCYQLGGASFITKPLTYHQWKASFYAFRAYWWQIVALPTFY